MPGYSSNELGGEEIYNFDDGSGDSFDVGCRFPHFTGETKMNPEREPQDASDEFPYDFNDRSNEEDDELEDRYGSSGYSDDDDEDEDDEDSRSKMIFSEEDDDDFGSEEDEELLDEGEVGYIDVDLEEVGEDTQIDWDSSDDDGA